LPAALSASVASAGASPAIAAAFSQTPASGALFAAFLGYNPIGTMLQAMGPLAAGLPSASRAILEGQTFFPNAIADPFMSALTIAFIIAAVLCFLAAICSALRGSSKAPQKASAQPQISEC
jgi:hypothetical protein